MITFKSEVDLLKLTPANPAYPIIKEFIDRLIIEVDQSKYP